MNREVAYEINLLHEPDSYLLKSIKYAKELKRLWISNPHENEEKVKKFLGKRFPKSLQKFKFDRDMEDSNTISLDAYIEGLEQVLPRVSEEICFRYCEFTNTTLSSIVKSSFNTSRLSFINCKFPQIPDEYDFYISEEYKISYLNLWSCGNSHENDWEHNPERFKCFLKALSETLVRQSLLTINIRNCGLADKVVKDMLTELGMERVEVVTDCADPLKE
jgi:hypothetical protein